MPEKGPGSTLPGIRLLLRLRFPAVGPGKPTQVTETMSIRTIAIQSPGDMGHGVGRDLTERGFRVIASLANRTQRTRSLAEEAGIHDVGDLDALVEQADLVLSILPPASAEELGQALLEAMARTNTRPIVADCNAIAPTTVKRIGEAFNKAGAVFIDAGIIGLAPGKSELPTRFYCSGPDTSALEAIDGGGIRVCPLGEAIGRASAMKMVYASVTKGTMTLHAAALTAAAKFGLSEAYHAEMQESQEGVWNAMNRMVPRLPLDAGRWIGEMHEIASTYGDVGLPSGFHDAAAAMFTLLDDTPIAAETRETVDPNRGLDDALEMYVDALERAAK